MGGKTRIAKQIAAEIERMLIGHGGAFDRQRARSCRERYAIAAEPDRL